MLTCGLCRLFLALCTYKLTSLVRFWAQPLICWEECISREQCRSSDMVFGVHTLRLLEPPLLICSANLRLSPRMWPRPSHGSWHASPLHSPACPQLVLQHKMNVGPVLQELGMYCHGSAFSTCCIPHLSFLCALFSCLQGPALKISV